MAEGFHEVKYEDGDNYRGAAVVREAGRQLFIATCCVSPHTLPPLTAISWAYVLILCQSPPLNPAQASGTPMESATASAWSVRLRIGPLPSCQPMSSPARIVALMTTRHCPRVPLSPQLNFADGSCYKGQFAQGMNSGSGVLEFQDRVSLFKKARSAVLCHW
jgi:hypothetical protein